VIVQYIEPVAQNRAALGYDLQSDAVRNAALTLSRDTGDVVATAPITLVQETGTQKGVLAVLAVYDDGGIPATTAQRRTQVAGYAAGVYRLGDLLTETYADPKWGALGLRLVDVTDAADPVVLSERTAQDIDAMGPAAMADEVTRIGIDVASRDWTLEVRPTAGLYASFGSTTSPELLVGGLIVAALLEAFLLLVTGHERRARRAADESDRMASQDELTGLLNRRGFTDRLAVARTRVATEGTPQTLLYIDLDDFKSVNDSAGHDAGDALLIGVADVPPQQVRDRDTVGRIGGDEFAIILNNCGPDRGRQIADLLVTVIGSHRLTWEGREYGVGASIGATSITATASEESMHTADQALYAAKRAGKGRSHFT
jgi:diguanylate cyclase (GGDEF)-like protein